MTTNNVSSYNSLLSYFALKADAITRSLGATPVHWEEVFTAGVPLAKDTIVEGSFLQRIRLCFVITHTVFMCDLTVWTNSSVVASVVSAGYQVIAAPSDYWYLDHLTIPWTTMYTYDPTNGLTSSQVGFLEPHNCCEAYAGFVILRLS
jgi:N-acetyl-beta-hexosaminidase